MDDDVSIANVNISEERSICSTSTNGKFQKSHIRYIDSENAIEEQYDNIRRHSYQETNVSIEDDLISLHEDMETHYPIEHVENTNVTIRHNKKQKTNNRTNQESDQEKNVHFENKDDFLHDDVETQYPTEHEEVTNVTVRDKKNQKTKKQTKTKNKKENIDINRLNNKSKDNTKEMKAELKNYLKTLSSSKNNTVTKPPSKIQTAENAFSSSNYTSY